MKFLLVLVLSVNGLKAKAINYYLNPSSTAKEENGTITAPWKSFKMLDRYMSFLKPGDIILLKRGQRFSENLNINCSGTQQAPILFTAYGDHGPRPVIMYKYEINERSFYEAVRINKSNFIVFEELEISDYTIDASDHTIPAHIKIAFSIAESNQITIRNCDIFLVGIGVNIVGEKNVIDRCNIKNLRMVRNTKGGWDDYGANGIVIAGTGNIISNCIFEDCWANSFDFEFDGGAVEMAGSKCDNNQIIKNLAINCNGFMEFGSTDGGTISDNYVTENLVRNCGEVVYINNSGPYLVEVQSLRLHKNIFIETSSQLTKPKSMIAMATASANRNIILLQDNIFWLTTSIDVSRSSQFEGSQIVHIDNIYYLQKGKPNFSPHYSEIILDTSSTLFHSLSQNVLFK